MRKIEQRLWDRMREHLGGLVRLERVENVMTVGMPDVVCCADGCVTWVELKAVDALPVRAETRVLGSRGLSREQRNWHYDWRRHGGRSAILVGVGSRSVYLIDGIQADTINNYNLRELLSHSVATDWVDAARWLKGITG
jgi:hypothetical protein